ncbi:MAG: hypothetical protein ACRDFB_00285, partial [Rhabdochlamydiaceae bacterium]
MTGEQYTHLYNFYTSALCRAVRILLVFCIGFLLLNQFTHHGALRFSLVILLWFTIIEIFFRYHVYRYHPNLPVSQNTTNNLLASCTSELLRAYISSPDVHYCLRRLIQRPQIHFLLEKLGITPADIVFVALEKQQVLNYTLDVA